MRVIGLCGKTGSGKDTVAEYFALVRRGTRYKHSDWMREKLARNGRPVVPARMSALFEDVAKHLGYAWLANEVINGILNGSERDAGVFTVNGIRNMEEVAAYRAQFREAFVLVALEAPQRMRYDRVRNRGSRLNEHGMTWEEFLAIESLEAHTGEEAVIADADVRIPNEGTFDQLYTRIDAIL